MNASNPDGFHPGLTDSSATYVEPPYVPHREEDPDTDTSAVIVIARGTQEAIVVNLPALYALSDQPHVMCRRHSGQAD